MTRSAMSRLHPIVGFFFFLGAVGCGAVIQHPVYLSAFLLTAVVYTLLLFGKKGILRVLGLLPIFLIVTLMNPLFNHYGKYLLLTLFEKPYTLEALLYGAVLAGILVGMLLWFGCCGAVMTSDKFICLFGNLIPSLSLLLVMVLRLIPGFLRKTAQISGARRGIGKGVEEGGSFGEKLHTGLDHLSALTSWVLEGSVITGDSMRARGYGCGKRSSFQIYRLTWTDGLVCGLMLLCLTLCFCAGVPTAEFTPNFSIDPLNWGFVFYLLFLMTPIFLELREALLWRYSISKI